MPELSDEHRNGILADIEKIIGVGHGDRINTLVLDVQMRISGAQQDKSGPAKARLEEFIDALTRVTDYLRTRIDKGPSIRLATDNPFTKSANQRAIEWIAESVLPQLEELLRLCQRAENTDIERSLPDAQHRKIIERENVEACAALLVDLKQDLEPRENGNLHKLSICVWQLATGEWKTFPWALHSVVDLWRRAKQGG